LESPGELIPNALIGLNKTSGPWIDATSASNFPALHGFEGISEP
jgi:hypothetical protein